MKKFFQNFSLLTGVRQTDYVVSKTIFGCGVVVMKTSDAKEVFIKSGYPVHSLRNGKEGFYSIFGTVV